MVTASVLTPFREKAIPKIQVEKTGGVNRRALTELKSPVSQGVPSAHLKKEGGSWSASPGTGQRETFHQLH